MSIRRAERRLNSLFAMDDVEVCARSPPPELADAPRLKEPSGCARMALLLLCVGCACVSVVVFVGALATAQSLVPAAAPAAEFRARASRTTASRKPVPAILRRFALLERAAPPRHGVDAASLHSVFPLWGEAGTLPAVSDLALAVSTLAAMLPPEPEESGTQFSGEMEL